jgi:hypothetical protein
MNRNSPIPFPANARTKVTATGNEERDAACDRDAEVFQLCRETSLALQELRDGIVNVLFETLERVDLDSRRLASLIDVRLGVARVLIRKDVEEIATETLIEMLEKLQLQSRSA